MNRLLAEKCIEELNKCDLDIYTAEIKSINGDFDNCYIDLVDKRFELDTISRFGNIPEFPRGAMNVVGGSINIMAKAGKAISIACMSLDTHHRLGFCEPYFTAPAALLHIPISPIEHHTPFWYQGRYADEIDDSPEFTLGRDMILQRKAPLSAYNENFRYSGANGNKLIGDNTLTVTFGEILDKDKFKQFEGMVVKHLDYAENNKPKKQKKYQGYPAAGRSMEQHNLIMSLNKKKRR